MTPTQDEPKTIEELKNWFKEHGYEPAQTRFFAGVDVRSPKAFGIYLDEFGEYVVYKNKADGTRAIRYQGYDQEYAVHELYQRFQQEIINQQTRWAASNNSNKQMRSPAFDAFDQYERNEMLKERARRLPLIILLVFLAFIFTLKFMLLIQSKMDKNFGLLTGLAPLVAMGLVMIFSYSWLNGMKVTDFIGSLSRKFRNGISVAILFYLLVFALVNSNVQSNGYYSINNNLYYRAGSNWYHYDDHRHDWERSHYVPSQLTSSSWKEYNNTGSHQGSYESFEQTLYYTNWSSEQRSYSESHDNGHDYDYSSWSSNDWDSGYTDWNSDW